MDVFLSDERIMQQLVDEICEFTCNAWLSIAMSLNLCAVLENSVNIPQLAPRAILVELFKLMRDKHTPVDDYIQAVRRVCPAALFRPAHRDLAFGIQRTRGAASSDNLAVCRLPPHKGSMFGCTFEKDLAPVPVARSFGPEKTSVLFEMSKELVDCGVRMSDFRRELDTTFYNRFTANVCNYESMTPLMQFVEFLMHLRLRAYPFSAYKALVAKCAPDALNGAAHKELLAGV